MCFHPYLKQSSWVFDIYVSFLFLNSFCSYLLILALGPSILLSSVFLQDVSVKERYSLTLYPTLRQTSNICNAFGITYLYISSFFYIHSEIGFGTQSKFDVKVQRKERLLRKDIVSYIGGASEFTGKVLDSRLDLIIDYKCVYLEPGITLVLSPITIMPRAVDIGLPKINLGTRATRGEDSHDYDYEENSMEGDQDRDTWIRRGWRWGQQRAICMPRWRLQGGCGYASP